MLRQVVHTHNHWCLNCSVIPFASNQNPKYIRKVRDIVHVNVHVHVCPIPEMHNFHD